MAQEDDHAVKTRIPGTWGDKARYLWIGKQEIMEIHSGKTILTFLDQDKEYKLYSADNKVVGTIRGNELYEHFYDKVSAKIRNHDTKTKRKAAAATKEAPAPKRRQ